MSPQAIFARAVIVLSLFCSSARAQDHTDLPSPAEEISVRLDTVTLLDDGDVHIEGLTDEPEEQLILPDLDSSNVSFLTLYYSRAIFDDYKLSILVVPDSTGETLYVDLNNDEDLTNDGPPVFFPYEDHEVVFWLAPPEDPAQKTGRIIQRIPRHVRENHGREDWFKNMFDEDGNLKPIFATLFQTDGKEGTFFFDDRLSLRRGHLVIGDISYAIGIFDFNSNGQFNDADDLLLVDTIGDGLLKFKRSEQVFKLYDVFELDGQRYRLTHVDRYGQDIRLVEVEEEPTQFYIQELKEQLARAEVPVQSDLPLDSTFWDLKLTTLSGASLDLQAYRGQYLLLNVWGEWCPPCLAEFPAIIATHKRLSPSHLNIIGLLQTADVEAAQSVMEKVDIEWPQVELSDTLRTHFNIWRYPTNILISPNGTTYLEAGIVNERFFEDHIR